MKLKRGFTDPVPDKMEKNYQKMGLDTYHAAASFLDENRLSVGEEEIMAKHIVVVTGARSGTLSIPGAEHTITSDDFFHLEKLPERITFFGGGLCSF